MEKDSKVAKLGDINRYQLDKGKYFTLLEGTDMFKILNIDYNDVDYTALNITKNIETMFNKDMEIVIYDAQLPYVENIVFFLDNVLEQIENNRDYKIVQGYRFDYQGIMEILHNYLVNPLIPYEEPIIMENGHKMYRVNRCVDRELLENKLKELVATGKYPFIDDYQNHSKYGQTEIIETISYSIFEALVMEYFTSTREGMYSYYNDCVTSVLKFLDESKEFDETEFNKLFEKYVPKNGPAKTVAGEVVRGLHKLTYHMRNDGDNPLNYAARKESFWSLINCWTIVIEDKKSYQLYKDSLPEERKNKSEQKGWKGPDDLYIGIELDAYTIIDLVNFVKAFLKTDEGKQPNIIKGERWNEEDTVRYDIMSSFHENIMGYDKWIPRNQDY